MKKPFQHLLLVTTLVVSISGCQQTLKGTLVIKNVNVIDIKDGHVARGMDVVIRGNSIASIAKHSNQYYKAPEIIDGTDQYLLPGLWDMHAHGLDAYKDFFPLQLAHGVTGIRVMWGNTKEVKRIRKAVELDSILGPDIISAGDIIDGNPPGWRGSAIADTPEKGREIVRKQKADGADFIKVYSFLERDVYFAIADECKKQHIPFSGHIPVKVSLQEAIDAGHGSIEHANGVPEFCSNHYDQLLTSNIQVDTLVSKPWDMWYNRRKFIVDTYDHSREGELIEMLGNNKSWVCPTMVVFKGLQRNIDTSYTNDPRIQYMPEDELWGWNIEKLPKKSTNSETLETKISYYKILLGLVRPMQKRGVNFLTGTDYANPFTYPGFSVHEELQIFVEEAGFTPLEALQTATINPVVFLGMDEKIGTVEVGKRANLILLSANPLANIHNIEKMNGVILHGKFHMGDSLQASMEAVAQHNSLPKIKDVLKPILLKEGIETALTKYKELRKAHVSTYNFDESQLNRLGYDLLAMKRVTDAVKIFELNIEVYPNSGNAFDSLGDGYLANNEIKKAKEAYAKAIESGYEASSDKLKKLSE